MIVLETRNIYLEYEGNYRLRVWAWMEMDDGTVRAMVKDPELAQLVLATDEGFLSILDGEQPVVKLPVYVTKRMRPSVRCPHPYEPNRHIDVPEFWFWELALHYTDADVLHVRRMEDLGRRREDIRAMLILLNQAGLCTLPTARKSAVWLQSERDVFCSMVQITGNLPPPLATVSPNEGTGGTQIPHTEGNS